MRLDLAAVAPGDSHLQGDQPGAQRLIRARRGDGLAAQLEDLVDLGVGLDVGGGCRGVRRAGGLADRSVVLLLDDDGVGVDRVGLVVGGLAIALGLADGVEQARLDVVGRRGLGSATGSASAAAGGSSSTGGVGRSGVGSASGGSSTSGSGSGSGSTCTLGTGAGSGSKAGSCGGGATRPVAASADGPGIARTSFASRAAVSPSASTSEASWPRTSSAASIRSTSDWPRFSRSSLSCETTAIRCARNRSASRLASSTIRSDSVSAARRRACACCSA